MVEKKKMAHGVSPHHFVNCLGSYAVLGWLMNVGIFWGFLHADHPLFVLLLVALLLLLFIFLSHCFFQ